MPHPEDPKDRHRCPFYRGQRVALTRGEIALTSNEYKTAQRLGRDYSLYVVFHCATPEPSLNILQDPAKLDWQPIVKIEHYRLKIDSREHTPVLREGQPITETTQ